MKKSNIVIVFLFCIGMLLTACQSEPRNFTDRLEKGENLSIGILGTSLTGAWFPVLTTWLNEAYPGQCTFYNEGVGGSSTACPAGKSGLEKSVILAEKKPDVVFIEFTVNDSYEPFDISIEQSRENMNIIMDRLIEANPDVEIILQNMNYIIDCPEKNRNHHTTRTNLYSYMKMFKELAAERNLLLIDHYPNWKNYYETYGRDEYLKLIPDGLHPTTFADTQIMLPELKRVLLHEEN